VWLEGLGILKRSTSSGTRTGDLPAYSIVPQLITLPRVLIKMVEVYFCGLRCGILNTSDYIAANGATNNELERICKETVVV
jgi:hypothetical protein